MRASLSIALCLALSCGGSTAPPASSGSAATPAPPERSPTAATAAGTPGTAEEAPTPHVTYLDLVAAHAEAEARVEGDLRATFAGESGAKYTLGGWATRTNPVTVDGVKGVAGASRDTRLLLPRPTADAAKLTLRVRSARPGKLGLVADGQVLEEEAEVPAGPATVTFDLSAVANGSGDLALSVRAPGSGRVGGQRLGVAIGELRLGTGSELAPIPAPAEGGGLTFPAGSSLAWTRPIPPAARLRAVVSEGSIALRAHRDGRDPEALGSAAAGETLDADLGALAGETVRLELVAEGATQIAGAAIVVPEPEPNELTRPEHLLVVLVDTLRADKLGPYSPETRVQTPGLDAFVRQATTFARAHSQENWTKPSVATLLTGLMPWEHTATQHESVVPSSLTLLPEILEERGFQTGAFIANGYVSDRFGFDQGWGSYRNYIREGRRTRAENVAGDVLAWLDRRDEDKPFFLYVHTIDPHVPYRPPDADLALYGDPSYRGAVDFSRDATLLENVKRGRVRLNARDRSHLEALYDGEITYHDRHFRSILEGLERRGLAASTMVVMTSDHGEELFDHGSVGHGHSVYEELLHVPLFVKLPGEIPRRVDRSVGLVDVMPTVLEAFGLPAADLPGRSFLDALRGNQRAERGTVSAFMDHWRTLNVGRWKLVERPGRAPRLYDLDEDPKEENDLADARPIVRTWLRGLLGIRLAETMPADTPTRRRRAPRPERTVIDDETAAQLRALGYTGN